MTCMANLWLNLKPFVLKNNSDKYLLVLLISFSAETPVLSYILLIIYIDIGLRKLGYNICYFHEKQALATVIMLEIFIVLFRSNSSSQLNLTFIYFPS